MIQGRDPNEIASQEEEQEQEQEEDILPEPSQNNLKIIADELSNVVEISKKRRIYQYVIQNKVSFIFQRMYDLEQFLFLRQLKTIFDDVEDSLSIANLMLIFSIYKSLISLGDKKLIETLLSNQFYLDTFGALECNFLLSFASQYNT